MTTFNVGDIVRPVDMEYFKLHHPQVRETDTLTITGIRPDEHGHSQFDLYWFTIDGGLDKELGGLWSERLALADESSPKPNSPKPNSPKPNSPKPNSPKPKTDKDVTHLEVVNDEKELQVGRMYLWLVNRKTSHYLVFRCVDSREPSQPEREFETTDGRRYGWIPSIAGEVYLLPEDVDFSWEFPSDVTKLIGRCVHSVEVEVEEEDPEVAATSVSHSDIRKGDFVQVTRKAKSHEGGWGDVWCDEMDDAVGKIGKVTATYSPGSVYLRFEDGGPNGYNFPVSILEKVDPPMDSCGIKVGDHVRVTCTAEEGEGGWKDHGWLIGMNDCVGKVGVVSETNFTDHHGVVLQFPDHPDLVQGCYFPTFVLEGVAPPSGPEDEPDGVYPRAADFEVGQCVRAVRPLHSGMWFVDNEDFLSDLEYARDWKETVQKHLSSETVCIVRGVDTRDETLRVATLGDVDDDHGEWTVACCYEVVDPDSIDVVPEPEVKHVESEIVEEDPSDAFLTDLVSLCNKGMDSDDKSLNRLSCVVMGATLLYIAIIAPDQLDATAEHEDMDIVTV